LLVRGWRAGVPVAAFNEIGGPALPRTARLRTRLGHELPL